MSANEIPNIHHAAGVFILGPAPDAYILPGNWGFTGQITVLAVGYYVLELQEPLSAAELGPPVSGQLGGIPLASFIVSPGGCTLQCAVVGGDTPGVTGHVAVQVFGPDNLPTDDVVGVSVALLRTPT